MNIPQVLVRPPLLYCAQSLYWCNRFCKQVDRAIQALGKGSPSGDDVTLFRAEVPKLLEFIYKVTHCTLIVRFISELVVACSVWYFCERKRTVLKERSAADSSSRSHYSVEVNLERAVHARFAYYTYTIHSFSDTLKVNAKTASDLRGQRLKDVFLQSGEVVDLKALQGARDAFVGQHYAAWDLLCEMLRIDLDQDHPWHAPVSNELDALLSRYTTHCLARCTRSAS
jgi:hypothetical protein